MSKLLIISGHPDIDNESFANRIILQKLTSLLPQAKIHRLDLVHQHYEFDVQKEQDILKRADTIVLQFPLYWYAVPALMKKWIDDVLVHGFAYGTNGYALCGKKLLVATTSGSPENYYQHDGEEEKTIAELLQPLQNLSNFCKMHWSGIIHSGDLFNSPNLTNEERENKRQAAIKHAEQIATTLQTLPK